MALDKILLDMDGPVVDLVSAIMRQYGLPSSATLDVVTYTGVGAVVRKRLDSPGITDAVLWASVGRHTFRDAEPCPWAGNLVELCTQEYTTFIATAPLACDKVGSSIAKLEWLERHNIDLPVVLSSKKHMFAQPGALLIDDSPAQVENFRRAGGEAFLWPAPWNTPDYCDDSIAYAFDSLSYILGY